MTENEMIEEIKLNKKIAKSAIKIAIIVGFISVFFVVLNLAILLTESGAVAGMDKKLNTMQTQMQTLKSQIENTATQDKLESNKPQKAK